MLLKSKSDRQTNHIVINSCTVFLCVHQPDCNMGMEHETESEGLTGINEGLS